MLLVFIVSLIYLLTIAIIYFSKEKVENIDNKIYSVVIITNIIGLVIDICQSLLISFKAPDLLITFFNKAFLVYVILWTFLFTTYVLNIGKIKDNIINIFLKKISKILVPICIVLSILLEISYEYIPGEGMYSYGPAVIFSYIAGGTYITIMLISLISRYGTVNDKEKKKYIPLFIFLLFGIAESIAQIIEPTWLLLSPFETFVTVLTYFFIENPDVKMLESMEFAKNEAEKANRAKSDFLSSMSHEIRTPLNAIVGLSEDIGTFKNQVPKQVQEDSEDIISASRTLLEIVGNILDISKIESDKMEITEVPYDFKKELINLSKINAVRIGEKPINFKCNFAEDIPYELIGDRLHIKQIINNLLSNAIKYTNDGEINFNVKCINQDDICKLVITVQDTGIGIKAEMIEKLFNKFERLDVEKNTTVEGTGLGLAITKILIEMMGGKINVQSQYGKGSIFMVTIPQKISKMSEPEKNISQFEKTMIIPKVKKEVIEPNIKEPPKVDGISLGGGYGSKKILLADDNKLNIKVAKRALTDFNFVIDEASDGEEVLDKVKQGNKYDLILMDIMMPNMNGETALKELKKIEGFDVPVIALTADAVAGAKEHYQEIGFVDYLSKPFNRDQLKEKLDRIFK